jgi:ribose-phosphate pyrophosphokinase
MGNRDLAILGGSSHPEFVEQICEHLGVQQISVELGKFSNKESKVHIQQSVRGKNVVVIQSGCGSVNDNLVELMIMLAACKTASAKQVIAVLPCFPYSRQPDVPYEKSTSQILRYWTPASAGLNEREDSQLEVELTKKNKKSILYKFSKSVQFSPTSTPTTSGLSSTDDIPPLEAKVQDMKLAPLKEALEPIVAKSTPEVKAGKPKLFLPVNKPSISEIVSHSTYSTPGANDHQAFFTSPMYFPSNAPRNTGYKHWTARAGTLIANLLIESGKQNNSCICVL